MKLKTTLLRRHDGKMVVCNGMGEQCGPDEVLCDEDARHDLLAVHALMQAMDEWGEKHYSPPVDEICVRWVRLRADEIMRERSTPEQPDVVEVEI